MEPEGEAERLEEVEKRESGERDGWHGDVQTVAICFSTQCRGRRDGFL